MKTHNVRNMLRVGLIIIMVLVSLSIACSDSVDSAIDTVEANGQGLADWGNATADDISKAAEDAGIPKCVSCEIYDNLTD